MKENEIQEYLNSYIKPLQECKNAIIGSVSNAYHERKMNEVLSEICKKFGYERVSLLVANHVKKRLWDGRYNRATRAWTDNQPHIKRFSDMSIDTYERYCSELSLGNIHPVIVNSMTHWMAENEQNKEIFKSHTEEKTAKNRLIQRVENELNAYENWLLELPKKEILNHTHEYSVLCDIVFLIRDEDVISETTSEKLLLSRDILSDLSKDLEKFDLNINEEICTVIEERAKKLAEKSKEPSIDLVM